MPAKNLTTLAATKRREAFVERRRDFPLVGYASTLERDAAELMTLAETPKLGTGGEITNPQSTGRPVHPITRSIIYNTLEPHCADRAAEEASIQRVELLTQQNMDVLPMAIDAAASIRAENSIEKMLAHQMAVAHQMAMRFANLSLGPVDTRHQGTIEAARCANTADRLMRTFQEAALTLQRLRNGGSQTVTVQHVNVNQGGQAVIGSVQTGGKRRRATNGK